MLTPIKKAAGGLMTTTATTTHNATDFIASKAVKAKAAGSFYAKLCAGIDRRQYRAAKGCASIQSGASNTKSEAVYLPVSKVFSCPKFMVLDVGRAYPQGWPQRFGVVTRPHVHLVVLVSRRMVSEFPEGIKTMTHVTITTPSTGTTSRIDRQQAIENALSTALYFIRLPSTDSGLRAATGRAIRATAMLKQACAEISNGGGV